MFFVFWNFKEIINHEKYDIAFLDPPYRTGLLQKALESVPSVMSDSGIIVAECPTDEQFPESAGDFLKQKEYKYGKIKLALYRKVTEE